MKLIFILNSIKYNIIFILNSIKYDVVTRQYLCCHQSHSVVNINGKVHVATQAKLTTFKIYTGHGTSVHYSHEDIPLVILRNNNR